MEGIKIGKELLSEFSNMETGSTGKNGEVDNSAAVKSLEESLNWIVSTADKFARDNELTGLGEVSAEELSELTSIVLRRRFGSSVFRNSPEILLGLMVTGIVGVNVSDLMKKQKKEKAAEQNQAAENSNVISPDVE